ncbi:biotinidase-like [Thalassophryne amazonica]|uniref:biotinidase-like n=1 Tax=Thalassophryne amazonica TaxID=390379 RepID=UPI001471815C|nr:biotinidase-like [Thalassophryne amazonica]
MVLSIIALVSLSLALAFGEKEPTVGSSYIAAVYEHHLIVNPNPTIPLSRADALKHMQKNLDIYEQQAAIAAKQGAQILVFPEYGLHGFFFSRLSISGYLETVPDPQQESWNPCTEPDKHNTEVLQQLSCMARRNNLYIVANLPDLQPCPMKSEPITSCPPDGRWQFNTNVVFSSDGLLVARYHKQNLFHEQSFDTPPEPEIITFDTPFAGKFGILTSFDILFYEPTITLVEKGIRQLIFPTAWLNTPPVTDSIQFQRAFSLGANVTLLAANIHFNQFKMTGSGIYTPFSALYHHAQQGDPEEGKLLVATVPVLDELLREEEPTPPTGVDAPSSSPPPPTIFAVVPLNGTQGELELCNGTFCCHLEYRIQGNSTEFYVFGAVAGLDKEGFTVQACALARCKRSDIVSCVEGTSEAETKIGFLLKGTFTTKYVYPSLLTSGYVLEPLEHLERESDNTVTMKQSTTAGGLVTACLYGRTYDLDPAKGN